jgi:DNA-binding response OmpR family regulator
MQIRISGSGWRSARCRGRYRLLQDKQSLTGSLDNDWTQNAIVLPALSSVMQARIRTDRIVVNLETRTVRVGDEPLHLAAKEYEILELLSLHKGNTVTKEMLLLHLYGETSVIKLKTIRVLVYNLRKKLAQATGGKNLIETVGRRGYLLRDIVE